MPSISGRHNGRQLIVEVALVGVSLEADFLAADSEPGRSVFSEPVRALIDTGATSTSVSPQVAQALGLRPSGKRDVLTANGLKRRAKKWKPVFCKSGAKPMIWTVRRFPLIA